MLGSYGRVAETAVGWRILRGVHHLPLWLKEGTGDIGQRTIYIQDHFIKKHESDLDY